MKLLHVKNLCIQTPKFIAFGAFFPGLPFFFCTKCGQLAGLSTQPGLSPWKVQNPRRAKKGATFTYGTPGGY